VGGVSGMVGKGVVRGRGRRIRRGLCLVVELEVGEWVRNVRLGLWVDLELDLFGDMVGKEVVMCGVKDGFCCLVWREGRMVGGLSKSLLGVLLLREVILGNVRVRFPGLKYWLVHPVY
jgi:hypothetical protein